jgi:hypothetical protein
VIQVVIICNCQSVSSFFILQKLKFCPFDETDVRTSLDHSNPCKGAAHIIIAVSCEWMFI